ncbi:hypothetical protein [Parolsenella catena]|uniref:hypothetical protein n=1 Tax=Parolsenella catena TaxID=2003188 RepID=UPI002FE0419E
MTSSSATARPTGIVSLAAWLAFGYPALKSIDPLAGKLVGFSVFVAYVMLVVPAAMGHVAGRLRESGWRRPELMRPRDLVAHLAGDAQGTHALGDAIEDRG